MALSLTSIANYLFKRAQSKSSTSDAKQFFEETFDGRAPVFPAQVWNQADQIPNAAPAIADGVTQGVVKRYVNQVLTAVPGVPGAFQHQNLRDCIPFNFGDGSSYNYQLSDSAGNPIAFGAGDWIVDPAVGTLTFYGAVPANMPPRISFYQYVGLKGLVGGASSGITLTEVATDPAPPAAGQDTIYFKTDGKPYRISSSGLVSKLGGGAGGGLQKNYLADLYDGSSITGITKFNAAFTYTFAAASNLVDLLGDGVNYPANSVATAQAFTYTTDGTAIGGLVSGTVYYAVRITANIFGIASSFDNAMVPTLIDLTSQGTGNHTFAFAAIGGSNFGQGGTAPLLTVSAYTGPSPLPLRPSTNQRLSKAAGSALGQGIGWDIAIDPVEYINGFSLHFEALLRGSANYSASDLSIQFYDVSNNKPLKLSGNAFTKNLGTIKGIAYCSPTTTTFIVRIIITVQSTNANAWDLDFIDMHLIPLSTIVEHFRETLLLPTVPPPGVAQLYSSADRFYRQNSAGVVQRIPLDAQLKNYLEAYYDGTNASGIDRFNNVITITGVPASGVNTSLNTISRAGHGFGTGTPVVYTASSTVIGGLTSGQTYFVIRVSTGEFGLALTRDAANAKVFISLTSQGAGTSSYSSTGVGGIGVVGPTGLSVALLTAPSINTSSPLRSPSNLRLSKPALNLQGYGWSVPFTMDQADIQGGRLAAIRFKRRTLGTYADGEIQVYLYDVFRDRQVYLGGNVPGFDLPGSAAGAPTTIYFTPFADSTQYRLIFNIVSSSANSYDLDLSDLSVQVPEPSVQGAIITDWAPFVASGTWTTNTTYTGRSRRVGDSMEVQIALSLTGAPNAVALQLNMPPGFLIDTAKYASTSRAPLGLGQATSGGLGYAFHVDAGVSQTQVEPVFQSSNTGSVNGITATSPVTWANGNTLNFTFRVPIVGWIANASYSTAEVALKNRPIGAVSSELAGIAASSVFMALSGNFVDLPIGQHDLTGSINFFNNGTSAGLTQLRATWCAANGTNSSTTPAGLGSLPGVTVIGNVDVSKRVNVDYETLVANPITVICTQPIRVFLVPFATASAGGNMRTTAFLQAAKRPDYSAFGVYGQAEYRPITSTTLTPSASNVWHALANNFLDLPVGTWRLTPSTGFGDSGTAATYSVVATGVFGANGTGTVTPPAALSTLTNVDILSAQPQFTIGPALANNNFHNGTPVLIRVKSGVARIFSGALSIQTTSANARITTYLNAERLQ